MTVNDCVYSGSNPATESQILWSGSYLLFKSKGHIPINLTLTNTALHLSYTGKNAIDCYHFDEITSCAVVPSDEVHPKKSCCFKSRNQHSILESDVCLQLIIYAKKSNSRHRKRKQVNLLINTNSDYDENIREANLLHAKLTASINIGHAHSLPILIILNPHSGKGKTIKLFHDKVKPMFDDSNVAYQVLITEYANHACEFIQSRKDLSTAYSAIVTVSGDGLLFEVLNGFVDLLEGSSELDRIPIPISIIPGGSGNGLAHSINSIYLNGNKSPNEVVDCTFHAIKGKPRQMDIVRVSTPTKVYYSFLSFGWGLMADIDIESERLRCLGETRFALWSIYRSMALKSYSGTLSYLHKDNANAPKPQLEYPVSEPWVTINGNFVLVYAAYQKYLNSTVKFAPDSKLDDETIYLLYIESGVSSCQMIQFLLALEDGLHIKLPFVHFVPVKAFRLVPDGSNDVLTIDGEQIPCSPIQAEIQPQMASILLRS